VSCIHSTCGSYIFRLVLTSVVIFSDERQYLIEAEETTDELWLNFLRVRGFIPHPKRQTQQYISPCLLSNEYFGIVGVGGLFSGDRTADA